MKEPYEKGVAIRSAPSFALGAAKDTVKRKQGYRWAGLLSFEKFQSGRRRCHLVRKATWPGAITQVPGQSCVVGDPKHAWKLHTREPGDLRDACRETTRLAGGRRRQPQGPSARLGGVGLCRSVC
jgi:hypothetical protein